MDKGNCPMKDPEHERNLRILQNQMKLKQLNVDRIRILRTIRRIKADREVLELVERDADKRELLLAQIDAQLNVEEARLEMIGFKRTNVLNDLEKLGYAEPEPLYPRALLHPAACKQAPPIFMPPPLPRRA